MVLGESKSLRLSTYSIVRCDTRALARRRVVVRGIDRLGQELVLAGRHFDPYRSCKKHFGYGAACIWFSVVASGWPKAWKRPDPKLSLVTQATFSPFERGRCGVPTRILGRAEFSETKYGFCPSFLHTRDKKTRYHSTKERTAIQSVQFLGSLCLEKCTPLAHGFFG